MKKKILFVTLVFVILSVVYGCGSDGETSNDPEMPPSPTPTDAPKPTPEAVVIMVLDDFRITEIGEINGVTLPFYTKEKIWDYYPYTNSRSLGDDRFSSRGIVAGGDGADDNCVVNALGQGKYSSLGVTTDEATVSGYKVPHGALVFAVLQEMPNDNQYEQYLPLEIFPIGTENEAYPWLKAIQAWKEKSTGQIIIVAGIDTYGFSTQAIANLLPEIVDLFGNRKYPNATNPQFPPVKDFVANMSFVLAPCQLPVSEEYTIDDYKEILKEDEVYSETLTKDDELIDVHTLSDDIKFPIYWRSRPDLVAVYKTDREWYQSDPLGRCLANLDECIINKVDGVSRINFIPVAAAGNFRNLGLADFPLAPAIWSQVLSISASIDNNNGLARYSNPGEVMQNGAGPSVLQGFQLDKQIEGTSFSTPRASYYVARHLLRNGEPTCENDDGTKTHPYFGYADDVIGPWSNLDFESAEAQFCQPPAQ